VSKALHIIIVMIVDMSANAEHDQSRSFNRKPHSWKLVGAQAGTWERQLDLPNRPSVVLRNAVQLCGRNDPLRIGGMKLLFA
jgi:hypothetical protein